ncbi:transposable element Tcb2 transposase [Trichonephila clavipes]|nr:transposable element Tcb2 transposase [Trichonephila clavipes]
MGLQFLFMDDNAPCHRTVAAEQLLESRRLAARTLPPVTIRELRLALQDEWAVMPQQLVDTLILSMGRRCETCLAIVNQVTRHVAGRSRPVRSPSQKEGFLNVVSDRPESSTRAVAHDVSGSHQIICSVLNENRLHLFHFQEVQALNPEDYLLLPVNGTAMHAAARLHSSCAEQL